MPAMTPQKKLKVEGFRLPSNGLPFRASTVAIAFSLVVPQLSAMAADVTEAHVSSGKYQAHQEWLTRLIPFAAISGQSDSLREYAAKCDAATKIHVPPFSCDAGTEVPGQGFMRSVVDVCRLRSALIERRAFRTRNFRR